mgnify:CR=1 FL=1
MFTEANADIGNGFSGNICFWVQYHNPATVHLYRAMDGERYECLMTLLEYMGRPL